jgi:hypothetical protein
MLIENKRNYKDGRCLKKYYCIDCNFRVNYNRNYWQEYYQNKAETISVNRED